MVEIDVENRLKVALFIRKMRKQGDQLYFSIPKEYSETAGVDKGVHAVVTMTPMPPRLFKHADAIIQEKPICFTARITIIGGVFAIFIPKEIVNSHKLNEEKRDFDIDLELIF